MSSSGKEPDLYIYLEGSTACELALTVLLAWSRAEPPLKCLRVRGAVCGKLLGLDEVKGIDQRRVAPTLKPRDRRLVTKNWNFCHLSICESL